MYLPKPSERKWLLLVGLSLICVGLFSLLITNCIVNKENRAFVHYLELKVQQACNKTLFTVTLCAGGAVHGPAPEEYSGNSPRRSCARHLI